jgi:rubrerythrin
MAGAKTIFGKMVVIACAALVCVVLSSALAGDTAGPDNGNTFDNLQAAYNGESNANARFLAFAQKADDEGYGRIASLFRASARAEQVHFEHHAMIITDLGGIPAAGIKLPPVKSTGENLANALADETRESTVMYPQFAAQAEKDDIPDAVIAFEDAKRADEARAQIYASTLGDPAAWRGPRQDFYVCPVCGIIAEKLPPDSCPICSTPADQFITAN